jgi:hypothetical protein
MKNILSVFGLKRKPSKDQAPGFVLNHLSVCFDYINTFKKHQVQGLYAGRANGKNGQSKEATELMNSIISNNFSDSSMRRLFDPFIIISAILLTLQKYEPIFTYSLSQQLYHLFDVQNINPHELYELFQKLPTLQFEFLKSLFQHFEILSQNQTAVEEDFLLVYGEILIELSPKESLDETLEKKKSIQILKMIFECWHEVLREEPENGGGDDHDDGKGDDSRDGTHEDESSEHSPPIELYSIQDRTVKVSFPKGDDEENTITKPQLTKVMASFGEISEVHRLLLLFPHNPLLPWWCYRLDGRRSFVWSHSDTWRVS